MRTQLTQRTLLILLLVFGAWNTVFAQGTTLDAYIRQGLAANIVIQQQKTSVEQAMTALKQARALYLPTVNLQAGYQTGEGGRSISIPIGDLMNPVYSTLNQLTNSSKFPQISNVNSYFLPNNFTDAKLVSTLPLYNSDLQYNKQLRTQEIGLQQTSLQAYQKELVKEIRTAYYNYLAAHNAISIYESALQLAEEGRRTNQKLIENGKGLPAYLLRAESDAENCKALLNDARQQAANALRYFNFLLNQPQDTPVGTAFNAEEALLTALSGQQSEAQPREELQMRKQALGMQQTLLSMHRDFRLPKLNAFAQTGIQGEKFKFNNKSPYYLVGLQLEVPLFQGKSNLLKIRQSELDVNRAQQELEYTTQQLVLSATVARNNFQSSYQLYLSNRKRAEAAAAYQRLIDKGYKEGVNSFIETVDARNQLTQAQLAVNQQCYKVLIQAAQLERELGTYLIK